MNREIKFRGKRVDNGEWVYGSLIQCDITGKRYILPIGSDANESDKVGHEGCLMLFTFEVIPETVGQYTGLKDKSGKDIYYGDIVEIEYYSYIQPECSAIFEVKFEGLGFMLSFVKGKIYKSPYTEMIEIIGNIYDNPELLEEKRD